MKNDLVIESFIEPTAVLVIKTNQAVFYATLVNKEIDDSVKKMCSLEFIEFLDQGKGLFIAKAPWDRKEATGNISAKVGDILITKDNEIAVCYRKQEVCAVKIANIYANSTQELLAKFGQGQVKVKAYLEWGE